MKTWTFGDIDAFMSPERAEFVRGLRMDEGNTWRGVAEDCAKAWGANWGSNQIAGRDLCRAAGRMLGHEVELTPWQG